MTLLPLLLAWLQLTLAGEQWRFVHPNGSVEALWGNPQLTASQRAELISAWVWSGQRAPRKVAPARISRETFAADSGRLAVRVIRRAAGKPPADLRLIAAPAEMWREVPEAALPAWPVPPDGRLALPLDPARGWRLRVAGSGEGSWWADLPPGKSSVILSSRQAPGLAVTVLDPGGRSLRGLNGLLQEPAGRGGTFRSWSGLRGEQGRLEAPGLPDEAELSLTIVNTGEAPLVLRGRPSILPHEVRLPAGAELSGRLVDRQGSPLSGARVEAEAWTASDLPQLGRTGTRSGPKGEWRLRGLPAGKVAWSARAPGYVPISEIVEATAGARQDLGLRTLEPGTALAVRVLDDTGAAVPGARVEVAGNEAATADASGVARLSGLPLAPLEAKVTAPRHLPGAARWNPPFPRDLELLLPRAFTVTGRFVSPSGAPISSGSVRLDSGACQRDERLGREGRFELDLPPSEAAAELVLRSPETRELRLRLAPGQAGEVRDLGDLAAPAGIAVAGQVVRASDGSPVSGAQIWTTRQGPEGPAVAWAARDLLSTVAGEDGRFQLSGLLAAPALLRVEAPGFARAQVDLPLADAGEGTEAPLDLGTLPLSAGTTLRVRVDPRGNEVQGAVARVDVGNRWLEPDLLTAQVWNGEAILPNVPAGRVTVSVLAGRKLLCEQAVVVAEASDAAAEQEVDCRRPSLRVAGPVTVGGVPVRSGSLLWQAPQLDVQSRIDKIVSPGGLRQFQVAGAGRPPVEVPVGPDGRFETDDLLPGTWQVVWLTQGSAAGTVTVEVPDLRETVETPLAFSGLALSGTVTDRAGKPVAGARVRELASGALAWSGADGAFSLAGLKPGKALVRAEREEETSAVAEVALPGEPPPAPLRLVLGERRSLATPVLVVDAAGRPVPGAFVFLDEEGKGQRLVTTAADGRATVTLEPPLAPRLRAAAFAGGIWGFGSWVGREDAADGITVALREGGSLAVRSPKRRGSPHILTPDGWDLSWLLRLLGAPPFLSPERPLQLTGLPAGPYRVALDTASVTLAVEEGKAAEGEIE